MGCVSCKKRSARITGLNLFQKRLENRKTVNTTTVKKEHREVTQSHKSPISVPKITREGWIAQCLVCGVYGSPQPFAELATSDKCKCEK